MNFRKLCPTLATLCLAGVACAGRHASTSFLVKISGHGKPMILIPGLSCGPDEWNTTVAHYQDRFECHVLTLPGFAGQPSIKAPVLQAIRDEIIAYIGDHHLDHPVLMGRSIGGVLALWIAAKAPNLVGKVVSVAGLPWYPALGNPVAKMTTVTDQALSIRSLLSGMSQQDFETASKRSLGSMISDSKELESILKTAVQSDPKAVGEMMFEQYTTDLRPQMSKIGAPVLLIGELGDVPPASQATIGASYEDQIKSIPKHKLVMDEKSRGFVMLDDPVFFFQQVDMFLG